MFFERKMRKSNKEITDFSIIESLLKSAKVCRVAFSYNNQPYIVPMNFGYENRKIYCHTGINGLKMDCLKSNPAVCIEIDSDIQILDRENPCKSSCNYKSIIAFGTGQIVTDPLEKVHGLDIIMLQLSNRNKCTFDTAALDRTAILRFDLHQITGKNSSVP